MTEENNQAVIENEQARAALYRLLARFYRIEVDETFLETLSEMAFPRTFDGGEIDAGLKRIVGYLDGLWERSLQELRIDYARTFIGHGLDGFSAAYPYESVYTSPERLMMQDARDKMLALYRTWGLRKDEGFHEPEDHIALELEFMAFLCQRRADALAAGEEARAAELLEAQRHMMSQHLSVWVPTFTEDMEKFSATEFYRGAALFTRGLLAWDRACLDELAASGEEAS